MKRVLLAAALVAALASAVARAQAPRASEPGAVPRTADGKPDLTGVWQGGSTQPGPWAEANAGLGVGGSGRDPNAAVVGSSNDRPAGREGAPYQDWAAAKVLEAFNRRGIDDPTGRCLPAGIPRSVMLGLFPQQFVQTSTQLVILYEYMSTFRVIPFGTAHPDDLLPSYMGNSVAHWDGDTLVVDVVGFNDKTWLAGTGTFHSDALHIVERYTRVSKDRIDYEVTMEDPNVLTKPWVLRSSLMLREGTRLQEYVCAENNLDLERYEQLLRNGVDFTRE
ncbi:MAG TPA: hypothetical protein VLI71_01615 [Gammaproteobacteria bacterium]|nr:hypothetical protein [Gammaproteobacteria bacterium]